MPLNLPHVCARTTKRTSPIQNNILWRIIIILFMVKISSWQMIIPHKFRILIYFVLLPCFL